MDASKLDFPDNHFDAVFDFGIIHHIPNWKDCIQELKRVLKPNGEVILEELSIDTF
jgi:ubiquinone/menaquinone biosynthesis C-methylase UbiE